VNLHSFLPIVIIVPIKERWLPNMKLIFLCHLSYSEMVKSLEKESLALIPLVGSRIPTRGGVNRRFKI
jgi:hypothetical protein